MTKKKGNRYVGVRMEIEARDRFKKLAVLREKTMIQYLTDLSKEKWEEMKGKLGNDTI